MRMSNSTFPTRLADLSLNDPSHNPSLYSNLRSIRKSTLSISNRLKSILEDAKFAKAVSEHFKLPLVANERCGSWYINPSDKAGSTYFKSTDGHHGQWDFSPRRLNIQLLKVLAAHGGAVLVDSTRRGKNLPDAFSKTVPIWVAVINRALFPEQLQWQRLQSPPPPDDLGFSEISQIEARLNTFTNTFQSLDLDIESLRRELRHPIRISWAINGHCKVESGSEGNSLEPGSSSASAHICHHIVLCSASRRVRGTEVSEGGYIQGAGDDSEGWSRGLTAQLFWEYKDVLLQTPEDEIPALVKGLLEQSNNDQRTSTQRTKVLPTLGINIGVGPIERMEGIDLIVNCQGAPESLTSKALHLCCRPGKLGSKGLRDKLPGAVSAVSTQLLKCPQSQILITCSTGKDLSVGFAVAALCLFYNERGETSDIFY